MIFHFEQIFFYLQYRKISNQLKILAIRIED